MQLLRVMFQPNSYKHYIIARLETNLHHLPKEKGGSLESLIKQLVLLHQGEWEERRWLSGRN